MTTDGNSSTMTGDIKIKWTNHFKYVIIKEHNFFLKFFFVLYIGSDKY